MNINNEVPNHSQIRSMNGGGIMDMMKAQMMTMTMMSSMNNGNNAGEWNNSNSLSGMFNMVYVFLITGTIDFLFNTLVPAIKMKVREYYNKKLAENDIISSLIKTTEKKKGKSSSITIDVGVSDIENVVGQSILDFITNCEKTGHISFKKQTYILNQTDIIQLSDDIFAQMNQSTGEDASKLEQIVEIFSYEKHVCELREFIDDISRNYTLKLKNKLGGQICYFNQHAMNAPKVAGTHEKNFTNLPKTCFFGMKAFNTNRRFTNLFGPEIESVRKRVQFFLNNEKWYNDKGIPYTLGLLLSGQAGAGKTSTIKCLANETKRHIININLNNDITKTQMENLFFNEMIMVYNVSTGQNEKYEIPLNKRIYVLEDIDCQGDLVHDRILKELEKAELKKILEKKEKKRERKEKKELFEMKKMMAMTCQSGMPNPMYSHIYSPPVVAPVAPPQPISTTLPPTIDINPSESSSEKLDLSFLLNLLDGVLEIPGRIVVMTSNHVSKLDKALIRPGRVDVIADFKRCTVKTITEMIEFFYDISLSDLEKEQLMSMRDYLVSPAEMGKIMFENFNEYLESIKQLQKLSDIPDVKVVELIEEDSDYESDDDTDEYNNMTDFETVLSDVSISKSSITNNVLHSTDKPPKSESTTNTDDTNNIPCSTDKPLEFESGVKTHIKHEKSQDIVPVKRTSGKYIVPLNSLAKKTKSHFTPNTLSIGEKYDGERYDNNGFNTDINFNDGFLTNNTKSDNKLSGSSYGNEYSTNKPNTIINGYS
jgi:5S rRNA maturation endonuclease (ribonuclease M5)